LPHNSEKGVGGDFDFKRNSVRKESASNVKGNYLGIIPFSLLPAEKLTKLTKFFHLWACFLSSPLSSSTTVIGVMSFNRLSLFIQRNGLEEATRDIWMKFEISSLRVCQCVHVST